MSKTTNRTESEIEGLDSDPSIPSSVTEEDIHPTNLRVGANSNLRTQVWEATAENWTNWPSGEFACAASEVAVTRHPNVATLTGLSNAFMRGRECRHFRIKTPEEHGRDRRPKDRPEGLILHNGSVSAAWEWLTSKGEDAFEGDRFSDYLDVEIEGTRFRIYRETQKGVRTFSALHLDQVTELSSIPKKWNVRRALRAVLTGQISEWHIDGVYTDDYARDSALNFQRGELESYLGKARRIWQDPDGWRVSAKNEERTELRLNCHQFDTNSIKVDLEAEALKIGKLTCLRWAEEHPADFFDEDPMALTDPA